MRRFFSRLRRLIVDRRGQDLVEYALLIGFFAFAAAATLPNITKDVSKVSKKVTKYFERNLR
jgi:Flp pilus assembly pilin Flp